MKNYTFKYGSLLKDDDHDVDHGFFTTIFKIIIILLFIIIINIMVFLILSLKLIYTGWRPDIFSFAVMNTIAYYSFYFSF